MKKLVRFFILALLAIPAAAQDEIIFICDNKGIGLSVVDVLQATGEHNTFLNLFRQYDPEGFAILSDPELADKTVWAPTDAAFLEISDALLTQSDEEIKAILGYHITPPRRTPEGTYPIITPQFLAEGVEVIHQTRTGILTGSNQRVRTKVHDGVYTLEEAPIMPIVWCTQSGSVFSITKVVMSVRIMSLPERLFNHVIYLLFYHRYSSPIRIALGIGVGTLGLIVYRKTRQRQQQSAPTDHG